MVDHLNKHLHNLQRIGKNLTVQISRYQSSTSLETHHLTTASRSASQQLKGKGDSASIGIHRPTSNQVIDRKFDGFLWRDALD
jgi:hypothetical protein